MRRIVLSLSMLLAAVVPAAAQAPDKVTFATNWVAQAEHGGQDDDRLGDEARRSLGGDGGLGLIGVHRPQVHPGGDEEDHGGGVELLDAPSGQGARVRLWFPRFHDKGADAAPASQPLQQRA